MTDAPDLPADVVDDGTSDVFDENDIVHVPPAVAQLVESHEMRSTYPPDIPNWAPGERSEATG